MTALALICSESYLDGEFGGPLVMALVRRVLVLVVSLDVTGHVVVDEVLAAELTGVVQSHKLCLYSGLAMVLPVARKLGRGNLLSALAGNPGPLERAEELHGVIASCLLRALLWLLSSS